MSEANEIICYAGKSLLPGAPEEFVPQLTAAELGALRGELFIEATRLGYAGITGVEVVPYGRSPEGDYQFECRAMGVGDLEDVDTQQL